MKRSLGRRAFLGGLGASTAAATFLRPILGQTATGAAPQRLLMIHRPCGSAMDPDIQKGAPSFWWPTSGASGGKDWLVSPDGLTSRNSGGLGGLGGLESKQAGHTFSLRLGPLGSPTQDGQPITSAVAAPL